MAKSFSEQRMIHNEAVFRRYNERVKKQLEELKAIAKEDHQEDMVPQYDLPLYFVCECADENCKQRILLKPSRYNQSHANRRQFIVVPGHESDRIERVVKKARAYTIVEKFATPPESASTLPLTPVDNT